MDIIKAINVKSLQDLGLELQRLISALKNAQISPDKNLSEFADELLKLLSEKLPYIEKVIWHSIDSVFAPRHFARQLAAIFLLQTGLMTWKTLAIASSKLTARMSKQYRVIKQVHKQMKQASTYAEWRKCAELADKLEGHDSWRQDPECTFYDREILQHRIDELTDLIHKGDIFTLMFTLRGGISRPQYGMLHEGLFSKALSGTKVMVESYLETVCNSLKLICDADTQNELISTDTKLAFFNESRHSFGRTALLLSGGASMGFYHLGVVKALLSQGLLPRVISGASAGSIVCAMVGTRTDAELWPMFRGEIITTFFKPKRSRQRRMAKSKSRQSAFWGLLVPPGVRAFASGLLSIFVYNENVLEMDTEYFRSVLRHNIGNYTFQEAFDRTGRIINITVSPINKTDPPRLLNYLTSPHVIVWSAAVCSASVPGVFDASTLLVKDPDGSIRPESSTGLTFMDGSMEADLPMEQLAELFNINHFVISQVNPHAALLSNLSMEQSVWAAPLVGLVTGLLGFLKAQVRAWTKHMVDLIILRRQAPSWSTRRGVGQLLTQEYEGRFQDITILPWQGYESIIGAFLKMVSNPSKETFLQCVIRAERNTFAHIGRVKSHCAIEMSLENAVKDLRQRLSAERDQEEEIDIQTGGKRDRTPSFYTSRSLVEFSGLGITDPAKIPREMRETSLTYYEENPVEEQTTDGEPNREPAKSMDSTLRIPYHTQVAGTSFVKSSSMANFYYRRTKSFDQTRSSSLPQLSLDTLESDDEALSWS